MTPVLAVESLSFAYGSRRALDDVSFSVESGEVLGLLGPNGSGKSTALALIAGLLPRKTGVVRFRGEAQSQTTRDFRRQIGVVFQQPALDDGLTVRQNLQLAARMFGLSGATAREPIDGALASAGLSARADDAVRALSGGLRRRLDIARALLPRPTLLLLDEPTAGLDEAAFRQTWQQIDEQRRQRQVTVIVSTHRPAEAERCDRVVVMRDGHALCVRTPEQLKQQLARDVVVVSAERPDELAQQLAPILEQAAPPPPRTRVVAEDRLVVECERGHELIPRLVEAFPSGRLRAVSLRQPTLADVFLKITGVALDTPQAADGERQ